MELKPKILQLAEQAHVEEEKLIAVLSEDERFHIGTLEKWSAKDILAHTATWNGRLANSLHIASQGQSPNRYDDIDHENKTIYEEFRDRPWEDVLNLKEEAYRAIKEEVGLLRENDLQSGEFLPWLEGRPLWRYIVNSVYTHPILHLADFYHKRGDAGRTSKLNVFMADALGDLDSSPDWQGMVKYNLACHYSLSGQTVKAISELREALHLNSGLVEWSKQDSDLEHIRNDPGVQAIYQQRPAGG